MSEEEGEEGGRSVFVGGGQGHRRADEDLAADDAEATSHTVAIRGVPTFRRRPRPTLDLTVPVCFGTPFVSRGGTSVAGSGRDRGSCRNVVYHTAVGCKTMSR